jgi:AraC-like DNA-binding protein/predicted transcriptional regulator YdeE
MLRTQITPVNDQMRLQLEKALLFIDQHLEEKITAVQIASYASIPKFHFQRLFSTYFGETLSQYVLHRRLEFAAKKLVHHKKIAIGDIANSSGFEGHSSFSRAFKNYFEISPSEFRNSPLLGKLGRSKTRFVIDTTVPKKRTIAVIVDALSTLWFNHKSSLCTVDRGVLKENVLEINADFKTLSNANQSDFFGLASSATYSLTSESLNDCQELKLYGGIYHKKQDDNWGDDWLEIESGLWAVCTHKGRYEYSYRTWNELLRSWLPESGYELRDTLAFELYLNSAETVEKTDDLLTQIYLPVTNISSGNNTDI